MALFVNDFFFQILINSDIKLIINMQTKLSTFLLQYVKMGPMVTTVSTTVVGTVLMTLLVTDKLENVKGDVNRDIPTRCAKNVRKVRVISTKSICTGNLHFYLGFFQNVHQEILGKCVKQLVQEIVGKTTLATTQMVHAKPVVKLDIPENRAMPVRDVISNFDMHL